MTDTARTHFRNADFDLSLRPRPRQIDEPSLVRQVRGLSTHALLGASGEDSVLLRADVPREFVDHLRDCGPTARLHRHPDLDPSLPLSPFGWNEETARLNRRCREPVRHPSLACIRRVNSRSFAREIEAELLPGAPFSTVVESVAQLETFLASAPSSGEWVIKSEFGVAGVANLRLRRPRLGPVDRQFVTDRLAEDDRMIVEPWLPRLRDWCAVFEVPFDPTTLRLHEAICSRGGGPIGAWFGPVDDELSRWSDPLVHAARIIASRLENEGYFGPVCADAFTWKDGDDEILRPLSDLNCRQAMSDAAYRFWRRNAPDRYLYYRLFAPPRLTFPEDHAQALDALGARRYDPVSARGILLASPLRIFLDDEPERPTRVAVGFLGDSRHEVVELETWFRRTFEK